MSHLSPVKLGVFCEQRGYFNAKETLEIFFLAKKKKKKKVQSYSLWWLGGLPAGWLRLTSAVSSEAAA